MPDWVAYAHERLRLGCLRPEREAEIVEEIARQLEDAYQESLRSGLSAPDAEVAATAHIDDWETLSAALRSSPTGRTPVIDRLTDRSQQHSIDGNRVLCFLSSLIRDILYSLRLLDKNRGFATVAILTLALGIGANTAVFSVIDAVLLRPLPVKNPRQLVYVYNELRQRTLFSKDIPLSYPEYRDLLNQSNAFSGLVAYRADLVPLEQPSGSQLVPVRFVSGNYFDTLGVKVVLGRAFAANEVERPGGGWVAVLRYSFWQRHFGGDPGVLGKTVDLRGQPFTLIGVAPPSFHGLLVAPTPEIWVPLTEQTFEGVVRHSLEKRTNGVVRVVGRLKPGTTMAAAQSQMTAIAARLAMQYPKTDKNHTIVLLHANRVGALPGLTRTLHGASLVLMVVVSLVLLIACANVAAMSLARSATRRKEIVVRMAVGAGRWQLIRQLLTESLLLSLVGGAGAVALTMGANRGLVHAISGLPMVSFLNLTLGLRIDYRVLLFTLIVVALTTALFGLAPALEASRTSPADALREGGQSGAGGSKHRLLNGLVVTQVALSLVLLICAGLSVRSVFNAYGVNPGFDTHGVVTAQFLPQAIGYEPAQTKAFYDRLIRHVRALPGVISAGYASDLPLTSSTGISPTGVMDAVKATSLPHRQWPQIGEFLVGPGYFRTLRIPLLGGRTFTDLDTASAPRVVIVNEAFAQHFWPHQSPLGRHIRTGDGKGDDYEVVGVVATGKYGRLSEGPRPFFYGCILQINDPSPTLVARSAGSSAGLLASIRQTARQVDPKVPIRDLETMTQATSITLLLPRLGADFFGLAGLIGLALACVGIYGVVSYSVNQRTHEIGIRVALGAQRGDVARLILARSLGLTLLGVGIGLGGAFAVTRLLSSILYGISATDPVTFIGVPALLILIALLACWTPACRAMRVDPVTALKYE